MEEKIVVTLVPDTHTHTTCPANLKCGMWINICTFFSGGKLPHFNHVEWNRNVGQNTHTSRTCCVDVIYGMNHTQIHFEPLFLLVHLQPYKCLFTSNRLYNNKHYKMQYLHYITILQSIYICYIAEERTEKTNG